MLSSQISYQIIRSSRKTMSLEIKADGSVVVRSPSVHLFSGFFPDFSGSILVFLPQISEFLLRKDGEARVQQHCPGKTASAE